MTLNKSCSPSFTFSVIKINVERQCASIGNEHGAGGRGAWLAQQECTKCYGELQEQVTLSEEVREGFREEETSGLISER